MFDKILIMNCEHFFFFIANLIMFSQGTSVGWSSPALQQLTSESTPLSSGPLSNSEVSWIGSINCLGGLTGSLSLGYFITIMGAKRAMLVLILPAVLFWIMIYFGDSYFDIFVARFLSGWVGGGIQTTVFLYIAEIANDE